MSVKEKKILIVDDDPVFCDALRELIEERGLAAVAATRCQEALEAYQKERPSVVLLDINMPDMGGLEALRRFKALDEGAVVVMVTAQRDDETAIEALKRGADGFVTKPLEVDYFWDVVTSRMEFPTSL